MDRFGKDNQDCPHYLFLDSDMWFVKRNTIPVMLTELAEAPASVFANQARIYGYYADRVIKETRYTTRWNYRCSPVCSLIANTHVFQKELKR